MSASHTPGPWRIYIDDCGDEFSGYPSIVSDELDCAIVHRAGFKQRWWGFERGDREMHANARLIASAPDLLAALKLLVADVADYEPWQRPCYAVDQANSAIAKAEGRS